MKIIRNFTFLISLLISVLSSPIKNLDENLILLIKRKFLKVNDSYLDDEYYRFDAQYLRTTNENCVFNKLNLIDTHKATNDEIKNFDAFLAFGAFELDYSTLIIYAMYSCIENVDDFTRHYFNKVMNDTPIFYIPKNSTECVKNELVKINKEKPMIENFVGLTNHTQEKCDEILDDIKAACESSDDDFRGCLKLYDEHSLEYFLKFTIMRNEKIKNEILEEELKKYTKEAREVNEIFVDCMIRKYL